MSYPPGVILQLPLSNPDRLAPFVEECIRDKVALIAVVGDGCRAVEDLIDDIILYGKGKGGDRFIATTSHPDETLEEVLEFVGSLPADRPGDPEVVTL